MRSRLILQSLLFVVTLLFNVTALANTVTVNLYIDYKIVNFAGKNVKALAINNQIPGPTLHFKEGDHVTINVYNHLDQGTSLHWHGLLVPWQMDGVAGLTQAPIPSGGVFHYQFTLHQSGTYWYHAHAGLQEQQGLYGAIIIDPKYPRYNVNQDYPIVLSDWSNTDPEKIYANLKKDGDYYASKMPLRSSLHDYIQAYQTAPTLADKQHVNAAYAMMQHMRMDLYDLADVAYDAFLCNGHPATQPWQAQVNIGDTVRLRFINAGASTFFHIKIPGATMKVINVQGNDIRPYNVNNLTIAPAETYDVLIKITHDQPYMIYAESTDTSGAAYGALITHAQQVVNYKNIPPFPRPTPQDMMAGMQHEMSDSMTMEMDSHDMPMNMHGDNVNNNQSTTQGTQYQNLISLTKTNDPHQPVKIIKMELSGYMDRYIWFINGLPEYAAKPIIFQPGTRYRFIFINHSMMHHPMHLHGHWFILRNGHGAYDPLLHTIDVPPYATVVADVDADANGRWYLHCHNLYHMHAGMAVVVLYNESSTAPTTTISSQPSVPTNNTDIYHSPIDDQHFHATAHEIGWNNATTVEMSRNVTDDGYELSFSSLLGSDNHKLQLNTEDAEISHGTIENADLDIFYWHPISEFWAIKGGANYTYRPAASPYWQPGIGIEGLAPYFINVDIRNYLHDGSDKLAINLYRDTQLDNNIFIRTGISSILATKTIDEDEIGNGLNEIQYMIRPYYRLMPGLAIFTEYAHTNYYGAVKNERVLNHETNVDNTLSIGLNFLF